MYTHYTVSFFFVSEMSESPVLVEKMSTDIRKKDVNLSEVCLLEESVSLSGGSFQPMHSLLLCPAQWSALLESPISLVRQPTDDEEKADIKHISNSNMDDVAGEGRPPNTEQLSERLTNIIIYIKRWIFSRTTPFEYM